MTYFLAFLAGLFGLGILGSFARPRYRDPNREFYDDDAQYDAYTHCDSDDRCEYDTDDR